MGPEPSTHPWLQPPLESSLSPGIAVWRASILSLSPRQQRQRSQHLQGSLMSNAGSSNTAPTLSRAQRGTPWLHWSENNFQEFEICGLNGAEIPAMAEGAGTGHQQSPCIPEKQGDKSHQLPDCRQGRQASSPIMFHDPEEALHGR